MRHTKRWGLGLLSLALLGNFLSMASADKEVPEFPLTMEKLEAFADPEELALVRSYSYYKGSREEWFLDRQDILKERMPYRYIYDLVSYEVPGGVLIDPSPVYSHRPLNVVSIIWNVQGEVVNLGLRKLITEDVELLSNHKSLVSIRISSGLEKNADLDLSLFQTYTQLESLSLSMSRLFNTDILCEFESLQWFSAPASYPQGPIRFSENCSAPIKMLGFGTARLDDIEVANLSHLKELYLGNATIHKLAIDGPSLPELEYINLLGAELPDDLSDVHFPEGLVQLNLAEVTHDSVNQLNLPDNLKYLNLDGSQISDYSFITTAENLESFPCVSRLLPSLSCWSNCQG